MKIGSGFWIMKTHKFLIFALFPVALAAEAALFWLQRQKIEQFESRAIPAVAPIVARPSATSIPEASPASPPNEAPAPVSPIAATAREWLGDVKQMKEYFLQFPDRWIPELSLLDERDFLVALQNADMSTESGRRAAVASLCIAAKGKLVPLVRKAMDAYAKAHGGEWPGEITELDSSLEAAANSEILSQYQIIRPDNSGGPTKDGPGWTVEEIRLPLDAEYDSHLRFGARSSSNSPSSPTCAAFDKAMSEYRKANNGMGILPQGLADLRPYLPAEGLDEEHLNQLLRQTRDGLR